MAIDFPSSPAENQTFTPPGGPTYVYHAPIWELVPGLVGAAPFAAFARNNIVVNSSFNVAQEYGYGVTVNWRAYNNAYWIDQWKFSVVLATPGSSNFELGSVQTSTPFGRCGQIKIYGAGNTFAGASDYVGTYQHIEGYRMAPLSFGYANAVPVTLSFWVYANVTGTFTAILGYSKAFLHNFTVNAANTWEYKTFTFPPDTTGAQTDWPVGAGTGAYLQFCFAAGSTQKTATPDVWATWGQSSTPLQSNFFASVNNAVYLTGVCLLPGSVAPTAAESALLQRSFLDEEALCQRYYMKIPMLITTNWVYQPHITSMRANPTVTLITATGDTVTAGGDQHSFGGYASNFIGGNGWLLNARL